MDQNICLTTDSWSSFLRVSVYCGAPVSNKKDQRIFPPSIAAYEPQNLAYDFYKSITQIQYLLGLVYRISPPLQANRSSVLTYFHYPSMNSLTQLQCAGLTWNRNLSERSQGYELANEAIALMKQQSPMLPCLMSLAQINSTVQLGPQVCFICEQDWLNSWYYELRIQEAYVYVPYDSGLLLSKNIFLFPSKLYSSQRQIQSEQGGVPLRQYCLAKGKFLVSTFLLLTALNLGEGVGFGFGFGSITEKILGLIYNQGFNWVNYRFLTFIRIFLILWRALRFVVNYSKFKTRFLLLLLGLFGEI